MEPNKMLKHLKRAIDKSGTRPVLQCIHYDKDGSVCVTDSHRLLSIEGFHEHTETFNLNALTMELYTEGVYPDTKRLVPDIEKSNLKMTISIGALLRAAKSLQVTKNEIIKFNINEDNVIISNQSDAYTDLNYEIKLNSLSVGDKFNISFNSKYIIEALEFFLDAKQRYAIDNVDIYMISPIRPVVMKIENESFTYLITPVRTN